MLFKFGGQKPKNDTARTVFQGFGGHPPQKKRQVSNFQQIKLIQLNRDLRPCRSRWNQLELQNQKKNWLFKAWEQLLSHLICTGQCDWIIDCSAFSHTANATTLTETAFSVKNIFKTPKQEILQSNLNSDTRLFF